MRYQKPRRNRFRSNDKGFRRNGSQEMRIRGSSSIAPNNFKRNFLNRNGQNAEKLFEKYNNLAKEALSGGDKVLSESYYQHADHFLRVIETRNSFQNNSKPTSENSQVKSNSDEKIIIEESQSSSIQQPQNSEEG